MSCLAPQGGQGGHTRHAPSPPPVLPFCPPHTPSLPSGYFALGVANQSVKVTETKLGTTSPPKSWGIDSDTLLEQYELNAGDTVGVAFDQSDEKVLRIYHNGQYLSGQDVRGMKGETWPLVIVAGGATLEVRNPQKLSLKSAIIFADGLLRKKSALSS